MSVASEDDSFEWIADHTDHKNTLYLHVQTEYDSEDYSVLWIADNIDYKDTWYLHVQTEYGSRDDVYG